MRFSTRKLVVDKNYTRGLHMKIESMNLLTTIISGLFLFLVFMPMPWFNLDAFLIIFILLSLLFTLISFVPPVRKRGSLTTILFAVIVLRIGAIVLACKTIFLNAAFAGSIIASAVSSFSFESSPVGALLILVFTALFHYFVIVKNSARRAKIHARLSLDSLPGRVMCIDSDLINGIVDENTAQKAKDEVRKKVDFSGAADGLSRYMLIETLVSFFFVLLVLIYNVIIALFFNQTVSLGSVIAACSTAGICVILSLTLSYHVFNIRAYGFHYNCLAH